jgi:hypothetical protein
VVALSTKIGMNSCNWQRKHKNMGGICYYFFMERTSYFGDEGTGILRNVGRYVLNLKRRITITSQWPPWELQIVQNIFYFHLSNVVTRNICSVQAQLTEHRPRVTWSRSRKIEPTPTGKQHLTSRNKRSCSWFRNEQYHTEPSIVSQDIRVEEEEVCRRCGAPVISD